jgi:hypothetical protein
MKRKTSSSSSSTKNKKTSMTTNEDIIEIEGDGHNNEDNTQKEEIFKNLGDMKECIAEYMNKIHKIRKKMYLEYEKMITLEVNERNKYIRENIIPLYVVDNKKDSVQLLMQATETSSFTKRKKKRRWE